MTFQNTSLWRSAFVEPRSDSSSDEQDFFRQHFLAMRERVKPIVARVMADMPGYTVHDISHLDALWETASLVADECDLSPPEAFVLGGAILLHDAAMTLAAYPQGLSDLKQTTEWKDALAATLGPDHLNDEPEQEELKRTAVEVLRILHAPTAERLATQGWPLPTSGGTIEHAYLIENSDIRHFYGPTIGRIAHSHWWSLSDVENHFSQHLGGFPPVTSCTVDLLKIACILRVADATHLDRRRAPSFVRALERPGGISALHWDFQGRIAFPHIEDDSLVFTAGEAFGAAEAGSWWLGYDAFSMADREIRESDLLLRDKGRTGFRVRRVKGANNPQELARLVPVRGWRPVETRVHITDIPKIVATLGGEKLYGEDPTAPLRELLQNSMDAIQARRRLEGRADSWGAICVGLTERSDGIWLYVEDNGVGMSERVMTGALLDFGASFWKSSVVSQEFPSLLARGMNSIGKFGIGFFSVFMLGDVVRVISRRYDKGIADSLVLTFGSGLGSRPILSPADGGVAPQDGGTRVEVRLRDDPRVRQGINLAPRMKPAETSWSFLDDERPRTFESLADLASWIAPASDTNISTNEFGILVDAVNAGDWETIEPVQLAARILGPVRGRLPGGKTLSKLMKPIVSKSGAVIGRAALVPSYWETTGVLCSGGIRVRAAPHLVGLVFGTVENAARSSGSSIAESGDMQAWATEQAKLISRSDLDDETKAECAEIILGLGGEIFSLPIIEKNGTWLTSKQFADSILWEKKINIYVGDINPEEDDPVGQSKFERDFEISPEIYRIPVVSVAFWSGSRLSKRQIRSSIMDRIRVLVAETWLSATEEDEEAVVGEVDLEDIYRPVCTLSLEEDASN